ncbi:glycosyltransferase family 2 protein [Cuneatibacter caecimuris]|uniref:Cellulose synthase/poly-beta-1,6-N-acetylglucosamine synthase-like glycosyltransferase n=1 Tax=Cuneatibacter caecimuris TaxID=1796618 RepID=A0A4Q7PNS4_9FIRM|nr:glycosyltransferase family 2 protein [Cuneatibacter caecimuris]RZT00743.1 cellulose synthase/poly-beta-1,6-N-acetylglucosamine synthase-like glycosyltransferase [Cuneatibacter caecimuris]
MTMETFIRYMNFAILVLFFLCYSYQVVYVFIRLLKKDVVRGERPFHRYAVIISARNESAVIGGLLQSINSQKYPKELLDVYVVADNCTDNTAEIAAENGATVFERFNRVQVGKGYALNYIFHKIDEDKGIRYYDAYMVFDADNVLDENYVYEMNKVFDDGYPVITSYRNSKNYDSNWISAGYALWFLRESRYLNGARMQCGSSCAISGTGFMVDSQIIEKNQGWKHHLLTEDIEFSVDNIIQGNVIGYCEKAVLYDEQPVRFKESWNQRLRWAKGFYQVVGKYGKGLVEGCVKHRSFQCFDMLMNIAPAMLLTIATLLINGGAMMMGLINGEESLFLLAGGEIINCVASIYLSLFFFGIVTTITEWKQIHCSSTKKILYLFTFPIFIFTYLPIAIAALFKKVTWTPIQHTIVRNVQEIRQ